MQATCTLEQIADELSTAEAVQWDAILAPRQLASRDGELMIERSEDDFAPMLPTAWAEGQLLTRLGIPAHYYRRCPPALRDAQFDHWLGELAGKGPGGWCAPRFLVRGEGGRVRAFLSPSYTRIDNPELVRAARRLESMGLVVHSWARTEQSFHLRLIEPHPRADAKIGDPLFAGVHLANSEVGMRTVTVDAIVHRLVCTNGLVALHRKEGVYRRRHQGAAPTDLAGDLLASARRAIEVGTEAARALSAARERRVGNPANVVERLAKRWSLPEEQGRAIARELAAEVDPGTVFALVNAVTAFARTQDPDERLRLETLASSLLNVN